MLKEFKEFAMRGSVVDLAVGVVIGAAFGKIVSALVDNVIMPLVGVFSGGVDFSKAQIALATDENGEVTSALQYGMVINSAIQFIIVAFVLFLVIKGINNMKRKEEEKPAEPPAPDKSEALLEEIRDLLKKKK